MSKQIMLVISILCGALFLQTKACENTTTVSYNMTTESYNMTTESDNMTTESFNMTTVPSNMTTVTSTKPTNEPHPITPSPSGSKFSVGTFVGGIAVGVVLVLVILAGIYYVRKRNQQQKYQILPE